MHPLLKRILINGGLTAGILAGVGLLFAHLAGMWVGMNPARAGATDVNPPLGDSLRLNVPLMMAFWGFVFVTVGELIRWRLRRGLPEVTKPAEPQPDVEKLLNELLAQAESKMATEQESGSRSQESGKQIAEAGGREQTIENSDQEQKAG